MRIKCKILRVSVCLFALLCLSSVGYASPPSSDVHFCLPLNAEDLRARDSIYAATKHAFDLNVGEPRTVRMIYFLPNDRPFRQEVVDSMKVAIRQTQTFYAEQMQAHGYGNKTFRVETDAEGEPMVHRVDGQHPDSHYLNNTYGTVAPEIDKIFNIYENIYFTVIDNSTNLINRHWNGVAEREGKNGGIALFPGVFSQKTAAHELGHVFGLEHDFRDNAYIMSYGPGQDRLSACNAEFLTVYPYFNPDTSPKEAQLPTIELISSPEYPIGSKSVSIQLKVSGSEGLHQVILFVKTVRPHLAAGFPEVKVCRGLTGERDAVVEFEYDGVIPSVSGASLSYPTEHPIYVIAIDTDGNVRRRSFEMWEIPPQRITTLEGHTSRVGAVAFSPDRTMLASGSEDKTVRLWNVAGEHIATLEGHTREVFSVAFSPDSTTLASGAFGDVRLWNVVTKETVATPAAHSHVWSMTFSPDGAIFAYVSWSDVRLWNVATRRAISVLQGHTSIITSIAFSPDGKTLVSGSWDATIKLWDVATGRNVATFEQDQSVSSVAYSPDGTILAFGASDSTIRLLNISTGETIATILGGDSGNTWDVYVAYSPDGTILASGSSDRVVKIWDVATKKNIATLKGHTNRVFSLAFSPDGTTLVSGSEDRTVKLWDMSEYVTPVVYMPDANLRAVIRDALGKSRFAPITVTDMASLTTLDASNRNIRELEGLESATNLTELNLKDNPLSAPAINTHIPALQNRGVEVLFDKTPTPDFDGDGIVDLADFLLFVEQFGFSEDDEGYDAQFDLDGDSMIGIGDFLIFANAFGKKVS
ncbi:MAG: hypothetical protein F4Y39_09815 [Gemmatimonadetes bacterium]|nr:hypothetical protein [Gemmatimonadota bacterium]MYG81278.1 hypothetical protein [Gemmatimonadota bacterium]